MEEIKEPVSEAQTEAEESQDENEKSENKKTPTPDYAAMAAADVLAIRAEFPDVSIDTLCDLQNPTRYAELRELGLSVKEAYFATERRGEKRIDNRSHLQSAVPRAVVGSAEGISREELETARDLFSGLSDHEIRKLYKKVTE